MTAARNKNKKGTERIREFRSAKAQRNFHLEKRFEAGLKLAGTEVKAIRDGKVNMNEAFCRFDKDRLFMYNCHIAEYRFGTDANHMPTRPRQLLLNKRELRELRHSVEAGGRTIAAVRMYFKQALVKVEIALAIGKKLHDKREDLKRQTALREAQRELAHYR